MTPTFHNKQTLALLLSVIPLWKYVLNVVTKHKSQCLTKMLHWKERKLEKEIQDPLSGEYLEERKEHERHWLGINSIVTFTMKTV
jgi:hypothetical protein